MTKKIELSGNLNANYTFYIVIEHTMNPFEKCFRFLVKVCRLQTVAQSHLNTGSTEYNNTDS